MTKVTAVRLAPLGIGVNATTPDPIEHPLVKDMHSDADAGRLRGDRSAGPLRCAGPDRQCSGVPTDASPNT